MNEIIQYIPQVDPLPLPAPVWLLKLLLIFTFILHLIPMNIMLGGLVIAGISFSKKTDFHRELARRLTKMIPTIIALTITMGIAPLLFVQVLYGQAFYASSLVMAWPWLAVILLVMVAYYLAYINSFKFNKLSVGMRTTISWSAAFLFAAVAFIYTNEMTMMLSPERWVSTYFSDPSGTNLNMEEPMLFPRYLHFVNGALAVAAMFVSLIGLVEKRETWFGKEAIRYGAKLFMSFTFIQYLLGVLWLISLPPDKMMLFMGKDFWGTIFLLLSIILSAGAIMMLNKATASEKPRTKVISAGLSLMLTLVFMALMRDLLRDADLSPYINLGTADSFFQASTIIPFVILLGAGLITVYWMVKKIFCQ